MISFTTLFKTYFRTQYSPPSSSDCLNSDVKLGKLEFFDDATLWFLCVGLYVDSMVSNRSFFHGVIGLFFLMVSNCTLYFHGVKLSSEPPHCDSTALVSMLMKPRCWHRRRLEGGLICPQPLVLSKTRSDQITPNQTILCHTIHYTFMFQCIKWSLPCATICLTNNLNCLIITLPHPS